ncbi:cell cycle progression protein 1 isoform X1 [Electrophorus electricus]|uniref:Cell cycle progression 1 n=1 Tax=Electrophorus electricus TaxID=8005 RepID=A0A4W4DNW0_ELEEL|nr:cell cycle progression protein 1 isoform X1 [Electrophorus electricus]
MSESSSDTESSCGWTVISNEGSDIESLGPESGAGSYLQEAVEAAPLQRAAPAGSVPQTLQGEDKEVVYEDSVDSTLKEATVVEDDSGQQVGMEACLEEHANLCSSSEHSDIVTLGDSREAELVTWEGPVVKEDEETGTEEIYLGTSSSSQYTFSSAETIFPAEHTVRRGSSTSTEDEDAGMEASPVVRRRRLRRSTAGSEPEEQQEVTDGGQEEAGQREVHVAPANQQQVSGTLNKCILLALVIAISMGFGHFYGTVQIQERQRMVEKIRVSDLSETRELQQCRKEQDAVSEDVVQNLREDLQDKRDMVTSLTGIMDKITKENQHLTAKEVELQAQRTDLLEQLQQTRSEMASNEKRLTSENHVLKNTLEREEASLSILQDELRHLRTQIRELEERGANTDAILSENQQLKDHLLEEKQRIRSFLNQKEALMVEAQALRKALDKEQKVTERMRDQLGERESEAGGEADPEREALQTRVQELEKKLSFEQQRSDLWERLYVETKEERTKGDRQPKLRTPKEGMLGKVKETFDAVKNSTKEFVHHHKEQIKKAKEAVKENFRKFSDSVKSTFRHLKNSASSMFDKHRRPQETKSHERKDARTEPRQEFQRDGFREQGNKHSEDSHWLHHRPLHQHSHKSTDGPSFHADRNTRKSGAQKEQDVTGQRAAPKGCAGVFDCAYQESMSLFNKAMDPIRADEFNQLLLSYLHQEVGHFHHWRELESFINNFFHNGLFIHDQMLFTDFVSGVEDYLEDMDEYQGGNDVFEDLDDYIYRHFFGDTYLKRYGPSRPFDGPGSKVKTEQERQRQQRKHLRPLPPRDRKWARPGRSSDGHFAEVKIELGPIPFDPKY